MADRHAYLHVGLHKTGTTYLQNLLRANRVELRAQGVEYLADPESSQRSATRDLKGTVGRGFTADPRVPGAWDRLVAGIAERDAPSVLISDEGLGSARPRQIHRAATSFGEREVHVVVTVRDIARVLVSQWQEQVKNDHTWTWAEYVAAVRDPSAADAAARAFWSRQDVRAILAGWEQHVAAERIHVVTVPAPGTPPFELLRRFSTVVGFDPTGLPNVPRWTNESVGAAGTEVIRRMNQRLGGRLNEPAYSRAVKGKLARALTARDEVGRLVLPDEHLEWAREHSDAVIAELRGRGYPVAGDLEDLRAGEQGAGRRPDEYSKDELLEASLDGLAAIVEEYAMSWWVRKKQSIDADSADAPRLEARHLWRAARRRARRLAARTPGLRGLAARSRRPPLAR